MRIYNFNIKQIKHTAIVGYGDIFCGEMYRVYDNKDKRLFTLEFPFIPSKNYLKRGISKNLYKPTLPF
jgi:hypothetical protein